MQGQGETGHTDKPLGGMPATDDEIRVAVAPMLIVRVETDWYAHDSEFRYVLQPGEAIPDVVTAGLFDEHWQLAR